MSSDQIQVTRTVNAAPEKMFALLATPARHIEFDGSSMLRGVDGSGERISGTGDQFIMNMNNDAVGDYQMRNTVVDYEENRKLGWAPEIYPLDGYKDKLGDVQATGHKFVWELEPAGEGQTKVTQTYDWSGVTDEGFRGMLPLLNEQMLSDAIDKVAAAAK